MRRSNSIPRFFLFTLESAGLQDFLKFNQLVLTFVMDLDLSVFKKPAPILEDETDILKRYILEPDISIHDPKPYFYPRQPRPERLYHLPVCPGSTTLMAVRDLQTGEILDFQEISVQDAGSNAKNSMSLLRAPGPPAETTRGSAANYPFWPGGFEELNDDFANMDIDNSDFELNFLTVAPGFSSGIEFAGSEAGEEEMAARFKVGQTVDLLAVIEDDALLRWDVEGEMVQDQVQQLPTTGDDVDEPLFRIAQDGAAVLQIAELETKGPSKAEWAEIVDITRPMRDFHKIVPDLAHTFPFELDTFQKHAIIKLEEHDHVFVAAHTSAGKTVVAEYAIALSRKHMTRVIYTSPIKALSNQKYRDFRQTFGDVGLITGDIQIDSTASCLIMTTEILKSMLYCGSDVTRDLEYVIFDEVHYITDVDRGHVWEEVLILLPDHVCIVMLSATVPNTLEFANWVGYTKKRKVYVISTLKRPVPLTHFLYTGHGGKSKDDIFLLVDENGQLRSDMYVKAIESREKKKEDHGRGRMGLKQEQNMWVGLIDHLRRNEKLPVIAFILSRNRCDSNAENLSSVDLCSNKEKYLVHSFFKRCIQKLKPPDRILPQVLFMESCLERGIGIHHSGILPILKEIVEMLFQHGLVKLLFATETFAMGVNMPARTVIFDDTRKYDRAGWRTLRPAEYTQMAGRAGRRGKDKTGTVIIVCKQDVPDKLELQNMILGKPMRLESQFRLTYSMILNLLRVERVTVEDMMSHSFKEHVKQLKIPENKEMLRAYEEKFSTLQALSEHLQPLGDFYDVAADYVQEWNQVMPVLFKQPKVEKEMKPGKILVVTHKQHYNKLGILLSVASQSHKETMYKVLVLDDQQMGNAAPSSPNKNLLIETDALFDRGELWHWMLSFSAQHKNFIPEGIGGHAVISVKCQDIIYITKSTLKVETDKILQNWEQRQIPRFRDAPPGQSVVKAVGDLNDLNNSVVSGKQKLEYFQFGSDFKILDSYENLQALRSKLDASIACTDISNFDKEFAAVYDRKQLEKKLNDLKFQLSNKNLTLYPDYCNKLEVLKALNYIDEQEQVAMKGRVACQMSQNELMITELVLRNILTDLNPAEIAALLSSLVFQAKTDNKPKLTETLKARVQQFIEVEDHITKVEQAFKVGLNDDSIAEQKLNFGLVEVVYEWARNKPFAEIMTLTDIKEGIIVRCITQLHETLRAVKDAARIIGDPTLHSKMEEASNAIKRDIVFAASLYTLKEDVMVGLE